MSENAASAGPRSSRESPRRLPPPQRDVRRTNLPTILQRSCPSCHRPVRCRRCRWSPYHGRSSWGARDHAARDESAQMQTVGHRPTHIRHIQSFKNRRDAARRRIETIANGSTWAGAPMGNVADLPKTPRVRRLRPAGTSAADLNRHPRRRTRCRPKPPTVGQLLRREPD